MPEATRLGNVFTTGSGRTLSSELKVPGEMFELGFEAQLTGDGVVPCQLLRRGLNELFIFSKHVMMS